jgi:hypothetical protein
MPYVTFPLRPSGNNTAGLCEVVVHKLADSFCTMVRRVAVQMSAYKTDWTRAYKCFEYETMNEVFPFSPTRI